MTPTRRPTPSGNVPSPERTLAIVEKSLKAREHPHPKPKKKR